MSAVSPFGTLYAAITQLATGDESIGGVLMGEKIKMLLCTSETAFVEMLIPGARRLAEISGEVVRLVSFSEPQWLEAYGPGRSLEPWTRELPRPTPFRYQRLIVYISREALVYRASAKGLLDHPLFAADDLRHGANRRELYRAALLSGWTCDAFEFGPLRELDRVAPGTRSDSFREILVDPSTSVMTDLARVSHHRPGQVK